MIRLALNHLLAQRHSARGLLAPHAGKVVRIALPPWSVCGRIGNDGLLEAATATPDATMTVPPWAAPRLALDDPSAKQAVRLTGDPALSADLARAIAALRWDAEADVARLLGDIPANRLGQLARGAIGSPRLWLAELSASLVEYLQEEAALLMPRATALRQFDTIDRLRDDVARLDKRVARYESPPDDAATGAA